MRETLGRIAKLEPRDKPDAAQMLQEIRDALVVAQSHGLPDRLEASHDVMHCLWKGQRSDGTMSKPWPGAIDSRVREASKVINDTVRLMMRAVRSGVVNIGPEEMDDEEKAQLWDKVLRKYQHKIQRGIHAALKLFFQCVMGLGYGVLHVDWRERKQLLPKEVTAEEVRAYLYKANAAAWLTAQAEGGDESMAAGGAALPPEVEAEMAQAVALMVEELLAADEKEELVNVLMQMDASLPPSEAKRAAKALSAKGVATYYAARDLGGIPEVKAYVPMVNVVHGMDMTGTNCGNWMAVPERLSEAGLRERAALNGWKVDVDALLKHPNRGLSELATMQGGYGGWDWLLNGMGIGLAMSRDQAEDCYEVVTVYRVATNEAGVPAVYESELFPALPELLLSHRVLPLVRDGEAVLPFVVMARLPAVLAVQSTGIAWEMLTDQLGMKKILDGSMAAAELAAFPPSLRYVNNDEPVMPGSTLTPGERNTGSKGAQSRFLEVPGVDMGAMKFLEIMRAEVRERYHRGNEADANLRAAYEEDLGQEAVLAYTEAITLLWAHIQAYVDEVKASRIAGKAVKLQATEEDLMGTADITVDFSATALNEQRAEKFGKIGTEVLRLGSKNVDTDALAEAMLRTFDVNLAERIILPGDEGAQTAVNDERRAIVEMQGGFEVTGRQNAPDARLSAYDEWLRNPANLDRCVYDSGLLEMMVLRMQGLEMQVQQFTDNVVTGQTGQQKPQWQEQQKRSERLLMMVEQRRQQMQSGAEGMQQAA